MSETAEIAVRIGILGVGQEGRHALETFVSQKGWAIAGAFDADARRCERLPQGIRRLPTPAVLLESADVDAVVISDEAATAEMACAILSAGKVAVLSTPIAWTLKDVETVRRCATGAGGSIVLMAPETGGGDFQMAEAALARPEMGAVRHIGWSLWSPPLIAAPASGGLRVARSHLDPLDEILRREAGRVAALARLFPASPIEVHCRIIPDRSGEPDGLLEGGEFSLDVRYEGGMSARLEVNRRTCLSDASGWIVSGSGGGYRKGRYFHVTGDGEIFDVPQPISGDGGLRQRLTAAIREGRSDCEWLVRTAALVRAARKSAASGQAIGGPC
jgi:predicted dehydrogenase